MGLEHPVVKTKFPVALVDGGFSVWWGNHFPPNPAINFEIPIRTALHHFKWRAALRDSLEAVRPSDSNPSEHRALRAYLEQHDWRVPIDNARVVSSAELRKHAILVSPPEAAPDCSRRDNSPKGTIVLVSFEIEGLDRGGGVGYGCGRACRTFAR